MADAGADALSLINTLRRMRIDVRTRRPILKMNTGGLSGPAVLPVAVRMVWGGGRTVKLPILGMGGVAKGRTRPSSCWPGPPPWRWYRLL